ncbi:MAG TPA: hypothetical protein DEQ09_05540, partial [Bacteroidales bacterium]|nr:hypothetical protein [Bacteroidales bacterium]
INDWNSADDGFIRTWKKRMVSDTFGDGLALDIKLEKESSPGLLFTFILYNDYGFISASGGIINNSDDTLQVKEIYALYDAKLYRGVDVSDDFAMVDGFSGGEPLEYGRRTYSPLTRSNAIKSRNNVLFTFTTEDDRETLLLGGLTYNDFEKFAYIEQVREVELKRGTDGEESLLCYLNLPDEKEDRNKDGEILQVLKGDGMQTWQNHEFRCEGWLLLWRHLKI